MAATFGFNGESKRKQIHPASRNSFLKIGVVGLIMCAHHACTFQVIAKPSAQVSKQKDSGRYAKRAQIFAHLEKQARTKISLPLFPAPFIETEDSISDEPDRLARWIEQRAERASKGDDKARYTTLLEHLLVAQNLLQRPQLEIRKQGYEIAYNSANFTAAHLKKDTWLLARIYEGFLLPQVALAHAENWKSPSRQGVLETAVSVFGAAGERPKQVSVLEWIISTGSKPKRKANALAISTNTMDWARGTLASLIFESPKATRKERVRALALLKAIQSPNMKGFKNLQTRVEASLNKQD